jgi:cyclic pyranopterin phosphate synthase
MNELLKRVPVSQLKFIGKKADPPADAIPADLSAALGPLRPLTVDEWRSLGGLDRHVLAVLVKNTRLLGKALNEIVPPRYGSTGYGASWSGAVARVELRLRTQALDAVLQPEFLDGRALVLACVAGRRAARRASELLDMQADANVGPVEIDWGLREADDVIFWQAHVSSWDGTFFHAASLLAVTAAAVALLDMVKALDPDATILKAGIREEPWQAGRDALNETSTAVYAKGDYPGIGVQAKAPLGDTVREDRPRDLGAATQRDPAGGMRGPLPLGTSSDAVRGAPVPATVPSYPTLAAVQAPPPAAPRAPSSTPHLVGRPAGPRAPIPSSGAVAAPTARPRVPASLVVAVVAAVLVANVVAVIVAIAFLSHGHR